MSSTAPPTIGYGPLEAFLGAEEGVSFKTENGQFLCTNQREDDFCSIEVVRNKVQTSKFFVEDMGNGRVTLKDSRGFYLRRTHRYGRHPIEVLQMYEPDISSVFLVCTRNGNVIFQCDNGLFLSRIESVLYMFVSVLEAAKSEADACCEFVPDIGSVIRPSFEIVSIEYFGRRRPTRKRDETVSEKEYINMSSLAQHHTFNLTWEKKVAEDTIWARAWGLNTVVSADAVSNAVADANADADSNADSDADAVANADDDADTDFVGPLRPTVTVCYDGVHGKRTSKEKIISEAETVNVIIPPKKQITAKLICKMAEQAEIPFTANIKKITVNGEVEMLTENGAWYGVVYDSVGVVIEEKPFYMTLKLIFENTVAQNKIRSPMHVSNVTVKNVN